MSRLYFSIRRRYIGLAISASCKMKSYGIPIKWLPHFSLTEDYYDHRDDNAFPSLSLFDLLKSNNKTFSVLSFTALGTESDLHSDEDRLKAVISEARTNPKDLYLVYLSTADEYGHKYGPNDERFRFVINGLDKAIEQFSLEMEEIDPECRFLYVGDHGMSQVDTHFDAERELRSLFHSENISIDKDVFFFLDSTMVRIWVNNQEYLDRVNDLMLRSDLFGKNGFWMNEV